MYGFVYFVLVPLELVRMVMENELWVEINEIRLKVCVRVWVGAGLYNNSLRIIAE